MRIYTILSLSFTIIEISITAGLGEFGLSVLNTCFLKNGTPGYWVAIFPIFGNIPAILSCLWMVFRSPGYKQNKALQKTLRSCLSMVVTWGFPTMTAAVSTLSGPDLIILDYFSFLLGCLSGLTLAICRLGSVEMAKRLILSLKKTEKHEMNRSGLGDVLIQETSVNDFFNHYTEGSAKDMILVLSLSLVQSQACSENFCFSYKKKKFWFNEKNFSALEGLVDLSKFSVKPNGIWEYEREFFEKIREKCRINSNDLIRSLCSPENFEILDKIDLGGRSGAFLFSTFDKKFFIKTVTRTERFFLLDLLPGYCKHILKHPESRLVRILGLFKIFNTKESLIIMENIFQSRCSTIYDLKGSTDNRLVDNPNPGAILKDQNFLNSGQNLRFSSSDHETFTQGLKNDCRFLNKFNIIDYSLIVGINPEVNSFSRYEISKDPTYLIGLIDFLQEYTLFKKLELAYKKLKGKTNTSVCSPSHYSSRFLLFIEKITLII
jgi:hypothetical protein